MHRKWESENKATTTLLESQGVKVFLNIDVYVTSFGKFSCRRHATLLETVISSYLCC